MKIKEYKRGAVRGHHEMRAFLWMKQMEPKIEQKDEEGVIWFWNLSVRIQPTLKLMLPSGLPGYLSQYILSVFKNFSPIVWDKNNCDSYHLLT